ncbi:hypothetical protein SAMN05443665_101728 [Actinomadura meyerae]|uniref:Uncharacterized protein n=1 Tax=Actinomadura meyerae TaxID=240840 RepID=A0A239K5X3_9ACTN|nr:hypothetical protein [Actinomadura meyerae]SNT13856.1 hypothetical protein SAMN05443665_101728 [Actinomadura meyerae]
MSSDETAPPVVVVATWNTRLWGRRRGHVQEVELTGTVRGAASHGYLTLTTPEGDPVPVERAHPKTTRPGGGGVVPPSARPVVSPRPPRRRIVPAPGSGGV